MPPELKGLFDAQLQGAGRLGPERPMRDDLPFAVDREGRAVIPRFELRNLDADR